VNGEIYVMVRYIICFLRQIIFKEDDVHVTSQPGDKVAGV
jgi:hypothetical protein